MSIHSAGFHGPCSLSATELSPRRAPLSRLGLNLVVYQSLNRVLCFMGGNHCIPGMLLWWTYEPKCPALPMHSGQVSSLVTQTPWVWSQAQQCRQKHDCR